MEDEDYQELQSDRQLYHWYYLLADYLFLILLPFALLCATNAVSFRVMRRADSRGFLTKEERESTGIWKESWRR